MRRVEVGMKKGSEWWCEEAGVVAAEKRRAYEIRLLKKIEMSYERYKNEKPNEKGCG